MSRTVKPFDRRARWAIVMSLVTPGMPDGVVLVPLLRRRRRSQLNRLIPSTAAQPAVSTALAEHPDNQLYVARLDRNGWILTPEGAQV